MLERSPQLLQVRPLGQLDAPSNGGQILAAVEGTGSLGATLTRRLHPLGLITDVLEIADGHVVVRAIDLNCCAFSLQEAPYGSPSGASAGMTEANCLLPAVASEPRTRAGLARVFMRRV